MKLIRLWWLGLFAMAVGCEPEVGFDRMMPTRPVTVIELSERDYERERTLTGVVNLYREEDIGFEIGGRVTSVLDVGLEVRGPSFNEQGDLVRQGDPIAAMESTRYGNQVGALQARLEGARRNLQAVEAQVTLARQTLKRRQTILAEGIGIQQAVDNAKSVFDQAKARLAVQRAAVEEVKQQLDAAQI